jgi:hypothetical protein
MPASFNKFDQFIEDLAKKVHNLNSDSLKVMLVDVAPVRTNTVKADLTEIAAGHGYVAGGNDAAFVSGAQTDGLYLLVLASPATWVAAVGTIGPFRYAVLYNDTPVAPADPLIGYWDYGMEITLQIGEQFTVALDPVAGVLTNG